MPDAPVFVSHKTSPHYNDMYLRTSSHQIFDPLGLSDGAEPEDIKLWREAEIKHGRVAMLASLGVLVAEVRCTPPRPW